MPDSEAEHVPSDGAIEACLRSIVARSFSSNQTDDLTVKSVRKHVELELDLEDEYLKSDKWNKKSKAIITNEVVCALHAIITSNHQRRANWSISSGNPRREIE
jgi:hypothetical protein